MNLSKPIDACKSGIRSLRIYWFPLILLVGGIFCFKHLFFPAVATAAPATTTTTSSVPAGVSVPPPALASQAPPVSLAGINVVYNPQPSTTTKESTSNEAFQAFEKQITDECASHKTFLETMDTKLEEDAKLLGGAAILTFGGILTFFGFRDRSGLQAYFQQNVDAELKKKLLEFEKQSEVERDKAISLVKEQVFSRLTREGEIETAVSQSLVSLGLYEVGKNAVGIAPWNKQLEPLLNDVLSRLIELQKSNPESRLLAIQIARFQDEYRSDLKTAINCLENTIEIRDNANLPPTPRRTIDDSALFYNVACYSNRLANDLQANGQAAESDKRKKKAQKAINRALKLVPGDADEARIEPELKGLAIP